MISDAAIQSWADGLSEDEPLKQALLELLSHRKAWRKPVAYAFADDVKLMESGRLLGGMLTLRKHGDVPLYLKPEGKC